MNITSGFSGFEDKVLKEIQQFNKTRRKRYYY